MTLSTCPWNHVDYSAKGSVHQYLDYHGSASLSTSVWLKMDDSGRFPVMKVTGMSSGAASQNFTNTQIVSAGGQQILSTLVVRDNSATVNLITRELIDKFFFCLGPTNIGKSYIS